MKACLGASAASTTFFRAAAAAPALALVQPTTPQQLLPSSIKLKITFPTGRAHSRDRLTRHRNLPGERSIIWAETDRGG